jgi:hypothetical protein
MQIICEIDRVLAQHYGLTDEELDFIAIYNSKYRMGRAAGLPADEAGGGIDDIQSNSREA